MSRKKRSKEEVEEILRFFAQGMSVNEISQKFSISNTAFYRLLRVSRGEAPDASKKKQESQIAKLKKQLEQRNKEIRLLKEVLKKS